MYRTKFFASTYIYLYTYLGGVLRSPFAFCALYYTVLP
jgi:hypothetical protein